MAQQDAERARFVVMRADQVSIYHTFQCWSCACTIRLALATFITGKMACGSLDMSDYGVLS